MGSTPGWIPTLTDPGKIRKLLADPRIDDFEARPVWTAVNKATNHGPVLIEPILRRKIDRCTWRSPHQVSRR
jgi:hypothetical protein